LLSPLAIKFYFKSAKTCAIQTNMCPKYTAYTKREVAGFCK